MQTDKTTFEIRNLHRGKNGRSQYVYADLYDHEGRLAVASTLDYLLRVISERGYHVTNLEIIMQVIP